MNEPTTKKLCKKHQVEFIKGYCPICYPFPRVFCGVGTPWQEICCGQPLTSDYHRARKVGARCWQNITKENKRKGEHMKESVEWVDTGSVEYLSRCYPDNEQTWSDDF